MVPIARWSRLLVVLNVALLLGAATAARAQEALKVGDAAPAFTGLADNGQPWRSADHVGKKILVVYFYPAAMTGGCTTQACMFRDSRSQLQQLGAEVVGVSGDRIDGLRAFKGANKLNFPLLSDTAGAIARAFGVPLKEGGTITRVVDGKEVTLKRDVTAARWTFIIDRSGRIVFRETEVDPAGDSKAVLDAIQRMTRQSAGTRGR